MGCSSFFSPTIPKREGVSFTAPAAGVADEVDEGMPKEKVEGTVTCALGLLSAAELAKKLGTAEEPLPVTLAPNCSAAGWLGALASTAGPGLGGMSAICGTAARSGVSGAGAETACDSAATVMGGDV